MARRARLVALRGRLVGDLARQVQCRVDGQGATADPFGQRGALDKLEDQGVDALAVLDAVDGADVLVAERGEDTRFAFEARQA